MRSPNNCCCTMISHRFYMGLAYVHKIVRMHQLEELDDIRVVELDAAAAEGASDACFVIGAVDVNVAVIGIAIGPRVQAWLQTF